MPNGARDGRGASKGRLKCAELRRWVNSIYCAHSRLDVPGCLLPRLRVSISARSRADCNCPAFGASQSLALLKEMHGLCPSDGSGSNRSRQARERERYTRFFITNGWENHGLLQGGGRLVHFTRGNVKCYKDAQPVLKRKWSPHWVCWSPPTNGDTPYTLLLAVWNLVIIYTAYNI